MNALSALIKFLQMLTLILNLSRDEKLRREGERRVLNKQTESAYEQLGEAHEIDLKAVNGSFSESDIDRMRKYERNEP